ncbi:MAG: hypothetical protein HF978_02110 [Desulfobacteraceae bacterium]|nr:hypothetical protein [Desulfobacteraceae bacterium]MBC2754319.1 hypothetical protein [Desulfobacteraceae bacterium]
MKRKKTNSEMIIDTLRSGNALRSPDITERVSLAAGKEIKIQDVASILAKLSNSEKCDLGYLINKKKTDRGYVYSLVKEAFSLTPEQTYDLTRKTGKDRFTLEEAVKKLPSLKKHVKPVRSGLSARRIGRSIVKSNAYSSKGGDVSDAAFRDVIAGFLKEVAFQGGLNVNVNLTIQFKGLV